MYSERKVQERLAIASKEFNIVPEYHTVEEVDLFERHMIRKAKYTYDDLGRPNGVCDLTDFESRWMLNEQVLVMCDAAYFLTRYAYLRDETGSVMRFKFRVPQRIYFEIVCDLEEDGMAIEILILKARQLGMSIFTELLIAHRIIFSYGASSVIGSADQTKTGEMSKMLLLCYDMLPVWLRPQYTSRVESDRGKLLFGGLASGVSFQHGSQKFGIATGSTPTIYHLSEVALYGDAAMMLIDEGLWKAVHASPKVLGVLESTGRSNKGWWASTWYFSKSHWPQCRMFPMFLPWYCGMDIYPTPTDMRKTPIPEDWRPNADTRNHVARAQLYVESNPLLKKHLMAEQDRRGMSHDSYWVMPPEQQWYWEWNHREAKEKGNEGSFLQEMAGDDEEALQHSEESVFGHTAIAEIDTRRERKYEAYTLTGQSIEAVHEVTPDYYDFSRERIPVHYRSRQGGAYRWELIPLKKIEALREDDPADAEGVLFVYHPPRPGMNYSIGVDTSEGKGQDSTVISVWTYANPGQADIQCAEFASSHVNHVEAFAFVMAIAAYYKKYMEIGVTKWKEPYVSIEQVASVGDTCNLQMKKMGYSTFHRMVRYDRKKIRKAKATAEGWFTHGWSRPLLVTNFVHSAQNGWADINSPWLIEEMKHFEVHITATGKEKLEHEEGQHDDRIMAAAMAIFCPHDMDILALRSKKRIVEPSALPPIDLGPWRGHMISAGQIAETRRLSIDDVLYTDSQLLDRYSRG
jgi:hypothetical protein